jgi:hypothetical protein
MSRRDHDCRAISPFLANGGYGHTIAGFEAQSDSVCEAAGVH